MAKLTTKQYKQPKPKRRNTMAKAVKATVDLEIVDNGKGVRYTLTPVDSLGNPVNLPAGTPPVTGVVTDNTGAASTLLALSVDPADTSGFGLIQIGTPSGALGTGIVATFSTTLPGATSPISQAADPVDVIAGPAGGFLVQESVV